MRSYIYCPKNDWLINARNGTKMEIFKVTKIDKSPIRINSFVYTRKLCITLC